MGLESSCVGRQGQGYVARDGVRIRVKIDRDRFLLRDLLCFKPEQKV